MGWHSDQFGPAHEGGPGAVLADGSEPGPVYLDTGSSGHVHQTSDWWIYDGKTGRQRAAHIRGACSCGWRGELLYEIDWERSDDRLQDMDIAPVHDDWLLHISEVESTTVPLPAELSGLLQRLERQLAVLCDGSPLAGLKAAGVLERLAGRTGEEAASAARLDDLPLETIGKALGLTESAARSRLIGYELGH